MLLFCLPFLAFMVSIPESISGSIEISSSSLFSIFDGLISFLSGTSKM